METALSPIKSYFVTLGQTLFRPAEFFKRMPLQGSFSAPLAFALVTHWVGSALEFLWRTWLGGSLGDYFNSLFRLAGDVADIDSPGRSAMMFEMRDKIMHWFWGAGSVVADPFIALASIFFTTFFVFIGARIMITPGKQGAPESISFESSLRIVCYGMGPTLLAGIPLFGGVIASIWSALVTIIGAKEAYRTTTPRAIVVALFPKILLLSTVVLGLFFLLLMVLKMVTSVF